MSEQVCEFDPFDAAAEIDRLQSRVAELERERDEARAVLLDLEFAIDPQVEDEQRRYDYDAPDDAEYGVNITAGMWRRIHRTLRDESCDPINAPCHIAQGALFDQQRPATEGAPARLTIQFRPLLTSGMLSDSPSGQVILIDSEQPAAEQLIALWHEVLHVVLSALGREHDEEWIETMARRLAEACPTLLTEPRSR